MARAHDVELRLGAASVRVGTWDEISITHDMLAPTSPWSATLWRPASLPPWPETELWGLTRVYTSAEVLVDGAPQLRGYIETFGVTGARQGSPLTISGRDQAGVAQVADADPALSLRNSTLDEVLRRMFDPLGINLTVGALAADARTAQAGMRPGARVPGKRKSRRRHHVDVFAVQPGQKVWQLAEQLCRRHGYLLYTAPSGDGVGLVIDRPAYDSPVLYQLTRKRVRPSADGSSYEWDGNIVSGGRKVDGLQTPTNVTVYGHSSHKSPEDSRHSATIENEGLVHPRVADAFPVRPRYIRDPKARTPQIAEQRARHEIARAMAAFDVCDYVVQGFGDGRHLYAINAMAHIDDELTGVRGDWLITQVTLARARSGGHTARLRLVPKGSIVIEPDAEV